jgi:serine protease Do
MYDPLRAKARVAIFTAVAFLGGLGIASGLGWTHSPFSMPEIDDAPQLSQAAVKPALDLSEAFTNVADVVTPAVVRIETRRPADASAQEVPDALRRFFGPDQLPESGPSLAGGSGFIVSQDGYIITNDHVVSGGDQVLVYLTNGRYFPAKIVGSDPFTDVAVIKIDAPAALPHLSFGDSEGVKVGEWVLAIGNPGFGSGSQLDYTVTAGIVSARGRSLQLLNRELGNNARTAPLNGYAIEDFIQTDAAINPGNSGGPLVDIQGRVIGINSAIASSTGSYQGYGFAVPINLARRVMEDLIAFGVVRRPLLGVSMVSVAQEDAEKYGLPTVSGVLVNEVKSDTPAERAGLRVEDVIVAIDGRAVGYPSQLQERIAQHHPGDDVTVSLYRGKRKIDVRVKLGEAPLNEAPRPVATAASGTVERKLGFEAQPLTRDNMGRCGFTQAGGVVISDVEPGGVFQQRSLLPCQKITRINEQPVTDLESLRKALGDVRSGEIAGVAVEAPNGQRQIINVRIP